MEKKAIACIAQPIDRAYNLHGGGVANTLSSSMNRFRMRSVRR